MSDLRAAALQALEALEQDNPAGRTATIAVLRAALAEQAQPLTDACTKLLQEALPHAEWQDKHIHPVGRETYQNWKVTVYLPVPLSEADKSPQAALARAVEVEVLKRMGVGK